MTNAELIAQYGNRVRIRVNGLILDDSQNPKGLLLVGLAGIHADRFWMPPGGGLNFGESTEEAVVREVKEETGLTVQVERLLYLSEWLRPPYHALELYFLCTRLDGELRKGYDPETAAQIIEDVRFFGFDEMAMLDVRPSYLVATLQTDLAAGLPENPRWMGTWR